MERIHCLDQLTLPRLAEMKAVLLQVQPTAEVCLDISAVVRVDTAGIQLLMAFLKRAQASGGNVTIAGESQALQAACEAIGVDLSQSAGAAG